MIDIIHQVILKVNKKKDPTNIPMIDIHISCTENMLTLVKYAKECGKIDYIPLTFATHWRIIIIWMLMHKNKVYIQALVPPRMHQQLMV